MTRFRVGEVWAAVLLLGAPLAAEATCSFSEQVLPDRLAGDQVKLLVLDPPDGGVVDARSVITVEVEYSLAQFAPDQFFLRLMFPTVEGGGVGPDQSHLTPL